MNIGEIKSELGLAQLNFNESKDGWFNHFINDERKSIGIHRDTIELIQSGDEPNLGLKDSGEMTTKTGKHKGETYQLVHIVAYSKADVVL